MKIQRRNLHEKNSVRNFYIPNEETLEIIGFYEKYISPILSQESLISSDSFENMDIKSREMRIHIYKMSQDIYSLIRGLISDFLQNSELIADVIQQDLENPEKTGEVLCEELDKSIATIASPEDQGYTFEQLLAEEPSF